MPRRTMMQIRKQRMHACAIAAMGVDVITRGECLGKCILVNGTMLIEHCRNGERHFCVVGIAPRRRW